MLGFNPISAAAVSAIEDAHIATVWDGQSEFSTVATVFSHGSLRLYAPTALFAASATAASNGKRIKPGASAYSAVAVAASDGRRQVFTASPYSAGATTASTPTTRFLEMLTDARVRRQYVVEIRPQFARPRIAS